MRTASRMEKSGFNRFFVVVIPSITKEVLEGSIRMLQLYCPTCQSPLLVSHDQVSCETCSTTWERKYGFISFLEDTYSYGNIPREKWDEIFSDISDKTNKEIQDYLSSHKFKGRWAYFNSFKNNKADGFSFLDVTDQDVILDIGCGPGSLTIPLAKRCREVYSLDPTLARLRFLDIRRKNEGLENITPIHASALSMPFREPAFDYILMNGVFEYIGEWGEDADPQDLQQQTLKRINGLLKKQGHIFIAIENRYGFDFLYKERDHSKLYLTGWLPRYLADRVTRILRKKPYRTYTYSFNGLKRMLEKAGFRDVEFYYVWPDYRNPKYIFAEKDRNIFRYYLEHFIKRTESTLEHMFFRLAYKLGVERHFVSNFIVVGKK